MHEGAVCSEIVGIALRVAAEHELTRIFKINVVTGPHSCLNEQELNFYFHVAQEGTIMDGAWITVSRDESLTGISQMFVRNIEGE